MDYALGRHRTGEPAPFRYSVVVPDEAPESSMKAFHVLYVGYAATVKTLRPSTIAAALVAELEGVAGRERDDAIHLVATAVRSGGRVGLVPGNHLARLGVHGSAARRAGVMLPVTVHVAVDPASGLVVPARGALDIPRDAPVRLETGGSAETPPDRYVIEAPAAVDVVCTSEPGPDGREPSQAWALYRLASVAVNAPLLGRRILSGLLELVRAAPARSVPLDRPAQEVLRGLAGAVAGEPGSRHAVGRAHEPGGAGVSECFGGSGNALGVTS